MRKLDTEILVIRGGATGAGLLRDLFDAGTILEFSYEGALWQAVTRWQCVSPQFPFIIRSIPNPISAMDHPTPVESSLDHCLKCNIFVSACPVAAVTDLIPGPKYDAPQAGRYRGWCQLSPDQSVNYCVGCRVSNLACPAGVKITELNARARSRMVEDGKIPRTNEYSEPWVGKAAVSLEGPVKQIIKSVRKLN